MSSVTIACYPTLQVPLAGRATMKAIATAATVRCPITGKRAYRTKRKAILAAERLLTRNLRITNLGVPADPKARQHAYRCPEPGCGAWHLTSHSRTPQLNLPTLFGDS